MRKAYRGTLSSPLSCCTKHVLEPAKKQALDKTYSNGT